MCQILNKIIIIIKHEKRLFINSFFFIIKILKTLVFYSNNNK